MGTDDTVELLHIPPYWTAEDEARFQHRKRAYDKLFLNKNGQDVRLLPKNVNPPYHYDWG